MIYIDGIIFSLQSHGGISNYVYQCILESNKQNDYSLTAYSDLPSHYGALRGAVGQFRRLRARNFERFRRCSLGEFGSRDVFHSSYYRLPDIEGGSVVTTVHDFIYEKFKFGLPRLIHSAQKVAAIKRSDAIICVSENTRRDLIDILGSRFADRTFVIPHGVSKSFSCEPASGCIENQPFLVFVGARGGYKRFDIAVELVARQPEFSLVAVGGGPLTLQEERLIRGKIGHRFKHMVGLGERALSSLYNQAHALIYPSEYEGFGLPILEAMSSGCPVLAKSSSSIPEVAGLAGLLALRSDVEEYLFLLRRLESLPARAAVVQLGREQAARFSWARCANTTSDLYRSFSGL